MLTSVTNVGLRGLAMSGRFVLFIALASFLPPAEVGLFALFTAASQWGIYLQGMEFHLFNMRELVAGTPEVWARRARDAFALYAIVFGFAIALWLLFFGAGFMPWRVFSWFIALLALEQAVQELYRLLNAIGRPLAGSFVLLARSGGWMFVVTVLMWRSASYRNLELVFLCWTIGGVCALAIAAIALRDLPWRGLPEVEWRWLRRGLSVSLPLLVGSLSTRGITVFERWFVGFSRGEAALGVFGLFAAIAGGIPVLAESGLGVVLYPRMMKAWQLGQVDEHRTYVRKLWLSFAVFVALACPLALLALRLAVGHLNKPMYADEIGAYSVLIASAAIASLAAVPQYMLWARNRDRSMVSIAICGLLVTVLLDVVLVPTFGIMGAAWGQLGAACVVFLLRVIALQIRST